MNVWVAVAAIIIGLFGQWGIIAYYAGRQTKALENVTARVDGHSTWIREVVKKAGETEKDFGERLIRLEERQKAQGR